MIKRLKKKLIILATAAMFILMALLVSIMNIINYSSVVNGTDMIINVLLQSDLPFDNKPNIPVKPARDFKGFIPRGMSPEVPYESRYFTVLVSQDGIVESFDISRIISVDLDSIDSYVKKAISSKNDRGFVEQFRYAKQVSGTRTKIIFLDFGRKLDSFRAFMWTSISVGLFGCIIVFIVFYFSASRIIQPIAESYDKQKLFITDAGHEIKTPLTIIGANLDLIESDVGENESISDIRSQVKRLSSLTNELVYLSKMEEETIVKKYEFSASDLISEMAQEFNAIAQSKKIDYQINVAPNIFIHGSPDAICRLVSILLDNAMKYSPDEGTVILNAQEYKKYLQITVKNQLTASISSESMPRLFDRFYRADVSRNSETGGHGIGLSIAKAITESHNGKITAETQNNSDFIIKVSIPL